jgi:hypothetical protein
MHPRNLVALVLLLTGSLGSFVSQSLAVHATGESKEQRCGESLPGKRFNRTELFLGLSRTHGSTIADTEFQRFVDAEIAPRFPDGFTVVAANGQFKDAHGATVRETARVLVVIYPPDDGRASVSLENIRASYKAKYQQHSVLRVDGEACASY